MNIASAQKLDAAIRIRIARGFLNPAQARVARAIIEVTEVDLDHAQYAARILDTNGSRLSSHQIRTNYRAAGITYDLVNDALKVAARAAAL